MVDHRVTSSRIKKNAYRYYFFVSGYNLSMVRQFVEREYIVGTRKVRQGSLCGRLIISLFELSQLLATAKQKRGAT